MLRLFSVGFGFILVGGWLSCPSVCASLWLRAERRTGTVVVEWEPCCLETKWAGAELVLLSCELVRHQYHHLEGWWSQQCWITPHLLQEIVLCMLWPKNKFFHPSPGVEWWPLFRWTRVLFHLVTVHLTALHWPGSLVSRGIWIGFE